MAVAQLQEELKQLRYHVTPESCTLKRPQPLEASVVVERGGRGCESGRLVVFGVYA